MLKTIKRIYSPSLTPAECACLFWYARNTHFFSQDLMANSRVYMWKYEQLVFQPEKMFKKLSGDIDVMFPQYDYESLIYQDSANKHQDIELSPEIDALCKEMWQNLEKANEN